MIKIKGKPLNQPPESTAYYNNHDSHTNGTNSENIKNCDLSILRKPIATSVTSFQEARKAFEHGTEEIKNLLSNECDIIYECKVCRNIFRSLANFISHKRCYCKTEFNTTQHFHFRTNGFIDHDISTIIQAEQEFSQTYNFKLKKPDDINKDLSSIVERLRRKQNADDEDLDDEQKIKLTEYYEQIHYKVTQDQNLKKNHVIQLERVPESSAAVYQTVNRTSKANIKDEVNELHNLFTNKQTQILGPEGVIIENQFHNLPSNHNFNEDSSQSSSLVDDDQLSCKICNLKFQTEKTLTLHIEKKHLPSTQVYPCPSCNETFLQPSAVIRHLNNDHKKSMRRIRLMRDAIYKKCSRADEVVVKGPSRELTRLKQSTLASSNSNYGDDNGEDERNQKKAWIENMENYTNSPMCTYCCKTFERKAVLATHIQSCRKKHRKSRNAAAASAKDSPIMVDLDKIKLEQRSDTPDSVKTNSTDSVPLPSNGTTYHLNDDNEIKQSNLHYNLTANIEHELIRNGMDTSESCSMLEMETMTLTTKTVKNKRKRKSAVKIVNEEHIQEGDEFYWVVEEKDGVSLKKLKTEEQELIFSDLIEPNMARPSSTTTAFGDVQEDDELPFVCASEVEKEAKEAEAAVAAAAVNGERVRSPTLVTTDVFPIDPAKIKVEDQPRPAALKKVKQPKTKKPNKETDLLKTIPCKLCPKLFASKRNLKLHVAMFHCRQNLFKCKFCEYHGYRKIDTRNHILLKHKFDCPPTDLDAMIERIEGKRQPLSDTEEEATTTAVLVKQEPEPQTPIANGSLVVASPIQHQLPAGGTITEESFDTFANQMIMEIEEDPVPEPTVSAVLPPAEVVTTSSVNGVTDEMRTLDGFFDIEEAIERAAAMKQQQLQQQRLAEEQKRLEDKKLLEEAIKKMVPDFMHFRQPSIDTAMTKKRGRPKGYRLKDTTQKPATETSTSHIIKTTLDTITVGLEEKKRRRRKKKILPIPLPMPSTSTPPPPPDSPIPEGKTEIAPIQPKVEPALTPTPTTSSTKLKDIKNKVKKTVIKKEKVVLIETEVKTEGGSAIEVMESVTLTKRPIRNRIKTVKEDFVYDLSHFLKKEDDIQKEFPHLFPPFKTAPAPQSRRQRASTISSPVPSASTEEIPTSTVMMTRRSKELAREAAMPARKVFRVLDVPVNNTRKYELTVVSGAAMKMAQTEANDHLACFSKPPDIPKERPKIPAKIAHLRRSDVDLKEWQTMMRQQQSPSPEKSRKDLKDFRIASKRSQRRASISSEFHESRRQRRRPRNYKSPSPPVLHLPIPTRVPYSNAGDDDDMPPKPVFSSFLDKLHEKTSKKVVPLPSKKKETITMIKCPTNKEFEEYIRMNQLNEPVKKVIIPTSPAAVATSSTLTSSPGGGGSKRITLLQRLAENKSRKSLESLGS